MKAKDFQLRLPTTERGWKAAQPEVIDEEKVVAVAGTQVTCPRCKAVIGRLSVPIFSGMRIPADAIEFERDQIRHRDEKAECRRCGEPYMKHHIVRRRLKTVIHTALGWI